MKAQLCLIVSFKVAIFLSVIKGNPITEHKRICNPQQKAHVSLINYGSSMTSDSWWFIPQKYQVQHKMVQKQALST